jgi:hypothetical protein
MWLFTKHGFFSAVDDRQKRAHIVLRSRDPADLKRLIAAFPEVQMSEVVITPRRDYPCRVYLEHAQFKKLAFMLASDIHYDNFKNEVYKQPGQGAKREALYHDVWSTMRRAEPAGVRGEQQKPKRVKRWLKVGSVVEVLGEGIGVPFKVVEVDRKKGRVAVRHTYGDVWEDVDKISRFK